MNLVPTEVGTMKLLPNPISKGRLLRTFLFLAAIALVTLGPLAVVLMGSFDVSKPLDAYEFGVSGWSEMFYDQSNWLALFYSLMLTIRVPIALVVALIIAWLLVRVKVPGRRYFEFLFWFAFFVPTVPMVTGWILMLNKHNGILNTWLMKLGIREEPLFDIYSVGGILWTHITLQTIPIMVILLLPTLRAIDRSFDDAALVSGASALTVLRKIVLPLSLPPLAIVAMATFIKALESFEVEQLLGSLSGISVYSNQIYKLAADDPPKQAEAMALSAVFLFIMAILALSYQLFNRSKAKNKNLSGTLDTDASSYSKRTKYIGFTALVIISSVTILLPFSFLISGSFLKLFGFFWLENPWTLTNWVNVLARDSFVRSLRVTLVYGFVCATIGALVFAALAWGMQNLSTRLRDLASVLVWLPWAFPGIILGIALLEVTLKTPVLSTLYGTLAPMVLALLIKELPIATHIMKLSLDQGNQDRIAAAQLAGAGRLTLFFRFILPLNTPALLMVFLLIFAAAVRTVDILLLLAPANISTLSILTYNFALSGDFEAATVTGTITALLALVISLIAYRVAGRSGYFTA